MSKPQRLHYTGSRGEYFNGVPARNLDEADIAQLSDEQLKEITKESPALGRPLYREVEAERDESRDEGPKRAEAKPEPAAAAEKKG